MSVSKMNRLDTKQRTRTAHQKTTAKSSAGFTLIEILIALSIALIIATIGMSALIAFNRATTLDSETQRVAAMIKDAHDRTLASQEGTNFGVHLEESSVTLFRGSSYEEGAPDNDVARLRAGVTLAHELQGGGDSVVFAQIRGVTTQPGTITVSAYGESEIIAISATGIVSIR